MKGLNDKRNMVGTAAKLLFLGLKCTEDEARDYTNVLMNLVDSYATAVYEHTTSEGTEA